MSRREHMLLVTYVSYVQEHGTHVPAVLQTKGSLQAKISTELFTIMKG